MRHLEKRQQTIFTIALGGSSSNMFESNMIRLYDNPLPLQSLWRLGVFVNYSGVKLPQKAKWLFWAHITGLVLVFLAGPFWEAFQMKCVLGEPAERGTGKNKANWSRKCHSLTLSQGDFNQKHSQCTTLNVYRHKMDWMALLHLQLNEKYPTVLHYSGT